MRQSLIVCMCGYTWKYIIPLWQVLTVDRDLKGRKEFDKLFLTNKMSKLKPN